jgi:hypothetical protein
MAGSSTVHALAVPERQWHACRSAVADVDAMNEPSDALPVRGTCLSAGSSRSNFHVIPCYTYLRVKLSSRGWIVVGNQNITLSLPEEDLREARILAASRGTSVSQLLARMLRELVEQETGYARARDRSLARLRDGMDLGTGGHISWSRDTVHDR